MCIVPCDTFHPKVGSHQTVHSWALQSLHHLLSHSYWLQLPSTIVLLDTVNKKKRRLSSQHSNSEPNFITRWQERCTSESNTHHITATHHSTCTNVCLTQIMLKQSENLSPPSFPTLSTKFYKFCIVQSKHVYKSKTSISIAELASYCTRIYLHVHIQWTKE